MVREDLISSAVSFLQDPSVSSAPLDKKIAFLQAKNLTQEEIDVAFSRTGTNTSGSPQQASNDGQTQVAQQQPASYRPPPPPANQNYGYGQPGQWGYAPPPPELPKRDWRDWFIMATVMGGVSYGLYVVAKRYITPLIAPPTPPQLQQDKENIDEQFNRAFTLLDQLSTDTAALKAAEDSRTERLDTALREVEDVVAELKSSSRRRDDDTRRISDEVRGLKDGIPKAIEGSREGNEKRLRELNAELKSLKVLLTNRLGSGNAPPAPTATPSPLPQATVSSNTPAERSDANGSTSASHTPTGSTSKATVPSANPLPVARENSGSPFSQLGKPASIPAWQLAASNKAASGDNAASSGSTAENQSSAAPPS